MMLHPQLLAPGDFGPGNSMVLGTQGEPFLLTMEAEWENLRSLVSVSHRAALPETTLVRGLHAHDKAQDRCIVRFKFMKSGESSTYVRPSLRRKRLSFFLQNMAGVEEFWQGVTLKTLQRYMASDCDAFRRAPWLWNLLPSSVSALARGHCCCQRRRACGTPPATCNAW